MSRTNNPGANNNVLDAKEREECNAWFKKHIRQIREERITQDAAAKMATRDLGFLVTHPNFAQSMLVCGTRDEKGRLVAIKWPGGMGPRPKLSDADKAIVPELALIMYLEFRAAGRTVPDVLAEYVERHPDLMDRALQPAKQGDLP